MEYQPTLWKRYKDKIVPSLMEQMGYTNKMEVPRLQKISLNQGVGKAVTDKKILDQALDELSIIAGQKAVPTYAKKSISNFKVREGMPIGGRVTLRSSRMYEFLERLIAIALPRVRDFKGVNDKGFDGRGNYTLGIYEQIIFPEVNIDKVQNINGVNVTFVTTAKKDKEAYILLKELGMPFNK